MTESTVYFATNRMPLGDPPRTFLNRPTSFGDGTALRFGKALVSHADRPVNEDDDALLRRINLQVADERSHADTSDGTPMLGSAAIYKEMAAEAAKGRDILVFIHGYWNSFPASIAGAAYVHHQLMAGRRTAYGPGAEPPPWVLFAFCWPSYDRLVKYIDEKERADDSGKAAARIVRGVAERLAPSTSLLTEASELERRAARVRQLGGDPTVADSLIANAALLRKSHKSSPPCGVRIHLLAHSMGNRVVDGAMRALATDPEPERFALFDQVILTGSDVPASALEDRTRMGLISRLSRGVTVYHSSSDKALGLSDILSFQPGRLGQEGPADMRLLSTKVKSVDVDAVVKSDQDKIDHWYHSMNRAVRTDIAAVLAGQPQRFGSRRSLIRDRQFKLLSSH